MITKYFEMYQNSWIHAGNKWAMRQAAAASEKATTNSRHFRTKGQIQEAGLVTPTYHI